MGNKIVPAFCALAMVFSFIACGGIEDVPGPSSLSASSSSTSMGGASRADAILLTANVWADGNLAVLNEQWFRFTATAAAQYIHVQFGTLSASYGLYAQLYDSGGNVFGVETMLSSGTTSLSRTLTIGQQYFVKIRRYAGSGMYTIAFNASFAPPGVIALAANIWTEVNIAASNVFQWFRFTATAATQYIHVDFGTLDDLFVYVYDNTGNAIGVETRLHGSVLRLSLTLTTGQTYYVRACAASSGSDGEYGTYMIAFNASFVPPAVVVPLTANVWKEAYFAATNGTEWFSFTATAATQYIHAVFGTLNTSYGLYIQVYDGSGNAVGTETSLYGSTRYSTRTLTVGQQYYVRVRPYLNYSGTYTIAFNASIVPPNIPVTSLTVNIWAAGSVPSAGTQWFRFTATASTQYIHVQTGTLTDMYLHVYDSNGNEAGPETELESSTYITRILTVGQTYYVRVRPSSSGGTYTIAFNAAASEVTLPDSSISLTPNTWTDGSVVSSETEWFHFTATAWTQYFHAAFGTLNASYGLYIQVYDGSGNAVGEETRLYSGTRYFTRTLTVGQQYYVRVRPYSSSYSGTYTIAFTASIVPPDARELTANTWMNGSVRSAEIEWFSFTATAAAQYIHVELGTLTDLYLQVYDSGSNAVGSEARLSVISITSLTRTLTAGQRYSVRVRPSSSGGTYTIAFSASIVPPDLPATLTENIWTNGDISSNGTQNFRFTATAAAQYIHVGFGTLPYLYVQVYDSSGSAVGEESYLSSGGTLSISRTLTVGQRYSVRVRTYSFSDSGTYTIAFNGSIAPPSAMELTANTWENSSLSSNGTEWFSFTATASTQYIHVGFGTLPYLYVQVYDSSSSAVGGESYLSGGGTVYLSRTLTVGQRYFVRVRTYSSGTYTIAFNGSIVPPGAIALTVNTWTNGTITSNAGQWFQFTATSSYQTIGFTWGTMNDVYIQLYTSSGDAVGSASNLYSDTTSASRTVTVGQVYYLRVWPYYTGTSGGYQIILY